MSEQQSGRMMGGGGGAHLGGAMKLFSSLGLTASDLNILAEIPEDEITVDTLPSILMQLKGHKGASRERGAPSSEVSYQGGGNRWESSLGPGSARAQASADFGFSSSMQDISSSRGFSSSYGGGGDGRAERQYSELSHQSSYGGLGMGTLMSDPVFMERRMDSPSSGKVQDFLGAAPPMFPHVCALCNYDVHSSMEWNQHIKDLQHVENKRRLLDMYPDWKPGMASGRSGGHRDTPNLSPGLLGPAPMSSGFSGGMSSSWGGERSSSGNKPGQNTGRSKVVVVKYDRKPLSNHTLFALAKMFGTLREHLILEKKAFLEMDSHEEALDMVNHYKQNPTSLYGKPITFYLSQSLMVIEKDPMRRSIDRPVPEVKGRGSKVVFFSRLPKEEYKKRELLVISRRFGVVVKYLFLKDEAFIQLGTEEDAEMLVKYYSRNPLVLDGRRVNLNICDKYKTLNVNHRQVTQTWRSSRPEPTHSRTMSSKSSSSSREEEKKKKRKKELMNEEEKKEEKKKKEVKNKEDTKEKPEEKSAAEENEEEEEEEVAEVLQGGEEEEEEEEDDDEEEEEEEEEEEKKEDKDQEEPERVKSVMEEKEEQEEVRVSDDVTAGGVATQEEGPEGQTEATETETLSDELKNKDEEPAGETVDEDKPADQKDQDFQENLEDFVTLDELDEDEGDASDAAENRGMRVISIMGFSRGYNFLQELLELAKPFGKVEKHLVLDRRAEAFIQFKEEAQAIAMHKFYNRNVIAKVCGRQVKISRSMGYSTIQTGPGRVMYIGQLPNLNYSDEDILKLAEPFGTIKKYSLHRRRRECFIEMVKAEDAEKMAKVSKETPLKLMGRRLLVYVSRKYRVLRNKAKRLSSRSPPQSPQHSDEPPAKKLKEEEPEEKEEEEQQKTEQNSEEELPEASEEKKISEDAAAEAKVQQEEDKQEPEEEEDMNTSSNQIEQTEAPPPADIKPHPASLPLPPYDPDVPIGVEYVKMGYYCRICFLFYSNKDTAMKSHCSSQAHYDKLQKHLEKEQTKAVKKKVKTAA